MNRFASLVLLLAPFTAVAGAQVSRPAPITVVFRMDDYSARSPFAVEHEVIEQFRARHLRLTVAAIPAVAGQIYSSGKEPLFPLTGPRAAYLRGAVLDGTVDVLQHGFTHQDMRGDIGYRSRAEFRGTSYQVQVSRIASGKKILEQQLGIPIKTFCPPYNTQDSNTLRAIEANGFTRYSSGIGDGGPDRKFDDRLADTKLLVLPTTTDLKGLVGAVESARKFGDQNTIIVVLFHAFELADGPGGREMTASQLASLLDWVQQQRDIRVLSLDDVFDQTSDLSVQRFNANRYSLLDYLAPALFRKERLAKPKGIYLSSAYLAKWQMRWWTLLLAFYAGQVLLFWTAVRMAWNARLLSPRAWTGARAISALVLVYFIVHPLAGSFFHFRVFESSLLAATFVLASTLMHFQTDSRV